MLNALARCSGRTAAATIGSPSTLISAAKPPCSTRATTSSPTVGARATSALDAPKPPTASRNAARGPARSSQRPAGRLRATSGSR
jgi:hypothetical protein